MNDKLVLHNEQAKASLCTREQVSLVKTPSPTETWFPIPHLRLIETVEQGLLSLGMRVKSEQHALTKQGDRYFGLLQVESDQHAGSDYAYVLGLRNAHDKAFNASMACGSRVFVCDNLAFSGEIMIGRKHTRFIERDLPQLVGRGIGLLQAKWHTMDERIARYKSTELNDLQAHDLLVRSFDVGAITGTQLPKVLQQWRNPNHPEFSRDGKTVWRLMNAFTEIGKENGHAVTVNRSVRMHGLLDTFVGFEAPKLEDVSAGTVDAVVAMN